MRCNKIETGSGVGSSVGGTVVERRLVWKLKDCIN